MHGLVALVLAAVVAPTGWLGYGGDAARTGSSATPVAPAALAHEWLEPLEGRVVGQPLVVRDVPARGTVTVLVGTSAGRVYALAPNGYVRWQVDLGQLARPCPQLDGWGVTGTPSVDPETRAVYVADAFGQLHALGLVDGHELDGWPVHVYRDYKHELVWGAISIVGGAAYVPTASYCDGPMEGKLVRVDLATQEASSWVAVPSELGGGGGIWGFGGAAYSAARDSLLVATGNAFSHGSNVGDQHTEAAGYGEQLVELSPALEVREASHPADVRKPLDLDFASGVVVARAAGCPELALVTNKNGLLYAWRSDAIAAGPAWSVALRPLSVDAPLVGQPAWSAGLRSLFVATPDALVRVTVDASCRPRIAWRTKLQPRYIQGSPTVAGGTVWLSVTGTALGLVAVDGRTGALREASPLYGDAYAAPAVLDGSLFVGTFAGALHGFVAHAYTPVRTRAAARSFAGRRGLEGREDGVYATEDGGSSWRRVLGAPALHVVRLDATRALAVLPGSRRCGCLTRSLWTSDGGRTWRAGPELRGLVEGRDRLYDTDGGVLRERAWPPAGAPRTVARVGGRFVALARLPGSGVAALASRRHAGRGWDERPQLVLRRSGRTTVLTLPRVHGDLLVRGLDVAWPRLVVRGTSYSVAGAASVTWTSTNGGRTWRVRVPGPEAGAGDRTRSGSPSRRAGA